MYSCYCQKEMNTLACRLPLSCCFLPAGRQARLPQLFGASGSGRWRLRDDARSFIAFLERVA